jgi:hypothetical protein
MPDPTGLATLEEKTAEQRAIQPSPDLTEWQIGVMIKANLRRHADGSGSGSGLEKT